MNNYLKLAISFVAGTIVGGIVTKAIVEKKKEREFEERYDSIVEYYSSEPETIPEDAEISEPINNEYEVKDGVYLEKYKAPGVATLRDRLDKFNIDYTSYSKKKRKEELDKDLLEIEKLPPINPQSSDFVRVDFSDSDVEIPHGYESEAWSLYSDGVLADSYGEVVDSGDVEFSIGVSNVDYFIHEDVDVMYIQNTANRTLYEVTKEPMAYSDTFKAGPASED